MICNRCDNEIPVYANAIEILKYAEGVYCSKKCAMNALTDATEEIFKDDEVVVDVQIEESDPYARYGLSWSDF